MSTIDEIEGLDRETFYKLDFTDKKYPKSENDGSYEDFFGNFLDVEQKR